MFFDHARDGLEVSFLLFYLGFLIAMLFMALCSKKVELSKQSLELLLCVDELIDVHRLLLVGEAADDLDEVSVRKDFLAATVDQMGDLAVHQHEFVPALPLYEEFLKRVVDVLLAKPVAHHLHVSAQGLIQEIEYQLRFGSVKQLVLELIQQLPEHIEDHKRQVGLQPNGLKNLRQEL